jgi:hypothetical protein
MVFSILFISALLSFASFLIIAAFTLFPSLRKGFPFYDPLADWVGHGIPDMGMIYMALVMTEIIPYGVPFPLCAMFFGLGVLVFLGRITTWTCYVWWQDLLHAVGLCTKVYMFLPLYYWWPAITVLSILYYAGVIILYIQRTTKARTNNDLTFGRGLFNAEHIFMSIAAILMLSVMQWH